MKLIKNRVLSNYDLPMSRREMRKAQLETPEYNDIMSYLESGILPGQKRAMKRIQAKAENLPLYKVFYLSCVLQIVVKIAEYHYAYLTSMYHTCFINTMTLLWQTIKG